jgi:hypothetical protein
LIIINVFYIKMSSSPKEEIKLNKPKGDSNFFRGDSLLNESLRSNVDEIKENRKFIKFLLKNLNAKKNYSVDILKRDCIELLKDFKGDISKITDEEKNSCKDFNINVVIHYFVKEEKLEYLKAVVEAYYILIEDKEIFFEWFTRENSNHMTGFEIAAQRSNKDIIKYIYEIIKKTDVGKLKLNEKRNNLFHYAAKRNECFPIVKFF